MKVGGLLVVLTRINGSGQLHQARLRGFNIAFAYVDPAGVRRDFTGRVNGVKMEGSFRDEKGAEGRWTATKK